MPRFLRSLVDAPLEMLIDELAADDARKAPRPAQMARPRTKLVTQTQEIPRAADSGKVKPRKRKTA
jgi:hypothetical protein